MKFFSILFLLMFFGCAPTGYYQKLAKGKEIQTGLQSKKTFVKGIIYVENSPIDCKVTLVNLDKNVLVREQCFSVKKGQDFSMSIQNGFYELNIKYKNRVYFFNVGSSYLNLWRINLKYFLVKTEKTHEAREEGFFIIKI